MADLYQREDFVLEQIPAKVFTHHYTGTDIFVYLHWHTNVEFNITLSGQIADVIDGKEHVRRAGMWNVVNSGELHSGHWIDPEDTFEGITLQISRAFLDAWLGEDVRFYQPHREDVDRKMMEFLKEFALMRGVESEPVTTSEAVAELHVRTSFKNTDIPLRLRYMRKLFDFLIFLEENCVRPAKPSDSAKRSVSVMKEVISYMNDHYRENLTLNETAEHFHYSSAHLSRTFKAHVGCNFHDYLQLLRLTNCALYLRRNPKARLIDAALEYGFPNARSFISAFSVNFGCTPSQWMEKVACTK